MFNINTSIIPCDYYRSLKINGKRKKSSAFMEYYDDLLMGDNHSIRFYSKSWQVAIATVHGWIKEFDIEIDKYEAAIILRDSYN